MGGICTVSNKEEISDCVDTCCYYPIVECETNVYILRCPECYIFLCHVDEDSNAYFIIIPRKTTMH